MLRKGKYKFIYYVDYSPELFDLEIDPEETMNLANNNEYKKIVKEYEGLVRDICDPEAVNRKAKEDQNILIEKFGAAKKRLAWVPLEHHQYQVKNINADGKLFGWSWICDYTVIVQFCDSMVR